MHRVFFSYSSEGIRHIGVFRDALYALQDGGHLEVWVDSENLYKDANSRNDWESNLVGALDDCDLLLALITPRYFRPDSYTQFEFDRAKAQGKRIVPVLMMPCHYLSARTAGCQAIPKMRPEWKRGPWILQGHGDVARNERAVGAVEDLLEILSALPVRTRTASAQVSQPASKLQTPFHPSEPHSWIAFSSHVRGLLLQQLEPHKHWQAALATALATSDVSTEELADRLIALSPTESIDQVTLAVGLLRTAGSIEEPQASQLGIETLAALLPVCGDKDGNLYAATKAPAREEWWVDAEVEYLCFVEIAFAKLDRRRVEFQFQRETQVRAGDPGVHGKGHLLHVDLPDLGFDADGASAAAATAAEICDELDSAFVVAVQRLDAEQRLNLPDADGNRTRWDKAVNQELQAAATAHPALRYYVTIDRPNDAQRTGAIQRQMQALVAKYGYLRVGCVGTGPQGTSWADNERAATRKLGTLLEEKR